MEHCILLYHEAFPVFVNTCCSQLTKGNLRTEILWDIAWFILSKYFPNWKTLIHCLWFLNNITHIYNAFQYNQQFFQDCSEKIFLPLCRSWQSGWFCWICNYESLVCWHSFPPFLSMLCKFPPLQRNPSRTIGQTFTGGWFCFLGLQSECYELGQTSLKLPCCLFL